MTVTEKIELAEKRIAEIDEWLLDPNLTLMQTVVFRSHQAGPSLKDSRASKEALMARASQPFARVTTFNRSLPVESLPIRPSACSSFRAFRRCMSRGQPELVRSTSFGTFPGDKLRVALHVQSRPACPSNPGGQAPACYHNTWPSFNLWVYDGPTLVGQSSAYWNATQFVTLHNLTGSTKTYTIKLSVTSWSSLSGTTYAVTWLASPYS